MSLEKRTHENGLTVYNDHIVGARTNDVRMYIPFGSVDEDLRHEGVTTYIASRSRNQVSFSAVQSP